MTGDLSSAGRAALLAGVDLSLCDRSYVDLGALAEEDPQVMTALDASCLRVLEMKDRFGLLGPTGEDGATDGSVGPGHPGVDPVDLAPLQAATARASRELAAASLVLLSNESAGGDGSADTSPAPVLPLDAASLKHLAVVGRTDRPAPSAGHWPIRCRRPR
jgi:beta-glucosidase